MWILAFFVTFFVRISAYDFCENTFSIISNKAIVSTSDMIMTKNVSEHQCSASCLVLSTCCVASYNKETTECLVDNTGNCNTQRTESEKWIVFVRDGFRLPTDCSDVCGSSGITRIYPNPIDKVGYNVYCEQDINRHSWTVIQRRINGETDFYRGWNEYKTGFGDLEKEFWLGNDKIHELTKKPSTYILRIELEDFENETRDAEYTEFTVGSEHEKYLMEYNSYRGDAGDSLSRKRGMKFTTKDQDNDIHKSNCAIKFDGAWWYDDCHNSNLNGKYLAGPHTTFANGIEWAKWKSQYYSLKSTIMMIKRQNT